MQKSCSRALYLNQLGPVTVLVLKSKMTLILTKNHHKLPAEPKKKICNRRPLVGAVGAYKRGDARRKDSDLCFAHSRVLRTFTCAPHIHLCHIHLCFAHSLVLFLSRPVFSCQSESPSFSWLLWAGQQTLLDG